MMISVFLRSNALPAFVCTIVVVSGVALAPAQHGSSGETLRVHKSEDKTRALPGSTLYTMSLLNTSSKSLLLEAIQMPGGYAGSGKFFHCGLQRWNTRRHTWTALRSEKQSDYDDNPIESVEVKG